MVARVVVNLFLDLGAHDEIYEKLGVHVLGIIG